MIAELTAAINAEAWDGAHYIYAFMPDGSPVGSQRNEEGRIHLNVNTWALFNGVAAAAGRVEQVLGAIRSLQTPLGHSPDLPALHRTQQAGRADRRHAAGPVRERLDLHPRPEFRGLWPDPTWGCGSAGLGPSSGRILPEATLPDIATGPLHQISNFTVGIQHEHFGRNLYSNFTGPWPGCASPLDRMFGLLPDSTG